MKGSSLMASSHKRRRFFICLSVVMVTGLSAPHALQAAPPSSLPCATEALAAIADIRTILGVLGLPAGPLNALNAKLDAAEQSITKGNGNSAEGQLGALRNQIEALAATGGISPADAQALLGAIDAALAVVTTCSPTPRVVFFNVRAGDAENRLFWVNPATSYHSTRVLFRTGTYPTSATDPAATLLGTFPGVPGAVGSAAHAALANGTTYYYAAFAEDGAGVPSAAERSRGRPDATAGTRFLWAYTIDRRLPIVGINVSLPFTALSDDALHSMESGPAGGGWPPGWTPAKIPAPADARAVPLVLPFTVGTTNRVSFVSSRTGRLYAVDWATGAILWTSPDLGGALQAAVSGLFGASGGLLFVGIQGPAGSGRFYGLNAVDGSIVWTFDNGGNMGPVVTGASTDGVNGRVYFTSRTKAGADTVWCLRSSDGSRLWSANPEDVHTSATRRVTPPVIYVGNTAGEIHALDADDGTPRWPVPYDTGDGPVNNFVFFDRFTNRLFFSTANQANAIEDTGTSAQPFWTAPLLLPAFSVPVPLTFGPLDTKVYIPTVDGRIYEVDGNSPSPTP